MRGIILIPVLTFLAFISCTKNQTQSGAAEFQYANDADSLGKVISIIEFQVKAKGEDLQTFDEGVIPWISIEKPEIEDFIHGDEIIVPFDSVTLIVDYPLNKPAAFDLSTAEKGFTRKQLIQQISSKYHEIYELEESTATTKTIPLEKREGLINRNQTNGKYEVWGHDMSDLDLSGVEVRRTSKGKIYLVLEIES